MSIETVGMDTSHFSFDERSDWGRFVEYFLASCSPSHSQSTIRTYRYTISAFFSRSAHGGPPKCPEHYTQEDVLDFVLRPSEARHNRGKPPSISAQSQRLAVLSKFYQRAAEYQVLGQDGQMRQLFTGQSPTTGLHHSEPPHRYRMLSYQEMERLFAAIPDTVRGARDRAALLVYFWTARRRSEIGRLVWGDIKQDTIVDPDGTVRTGWVYRFFGKGKGQQEDWAELPEPAYHALLHYLKVSGRLASMQPDSPLFVGIDPGGRQMNRPLTTWAVNDRLKAYAAAAGLDAKHITLHCLRHTAARERYTAGEDIRSIQKLLRHSNLAITDTYLRSLTGTADTGAKLLFQKFSGFSKME